MNKTDKNTKETGENSCLCEAFATIAGQAAQQEMDKLQRCSQSRSEDASDKAAEASTEPPAAEPPEIRTKKNT
eukprot:3184092-Amphidinium_carterae.1